MADEDEKIKLYREIIQRTDEHLLLERMRLHGFWPDRESFPADPEEELAERKAIEAEIAKLRQQYGKTKDSDKALAEERKRRWELSKQVRAERKAQRAEAARQRREVYDAYRENTLVHIGEQLSAGLQQTQSDANKLTSRQLPILHRGEDLAAAMELPLTKLRWLTYHRRGTSVVHYHRYTIAKKTGGVRCISAPKPSLARAQQWILQNILEPLEPSKSAHGFIKSRSILSNAQPHVQQPVVINLDLRDFFPSLTFRRIKGLFHGLGYSEHVATVLGLLCTEPPRAPAEFRGKVYHVALGERVLPQGACTSPAITNAICRRLDHRLAGLARKHGYTYTRYADDLTFSGADTSAIHRILRSVAGIVTEEGFLLHPNKTRVMRKSSRQEVTGVTVNERPNISREELRLLRAILHNARKYGLASQNRSGHPNFRSHLQGRIAFVSMIDPQRGKQLQAILEECQ